MTYADAVSEIQQMIDEGKPFEDVCAALARHADDGTILIDDVDLVIDGKVVPTFTVELGGDDP